MLVFVSPSQPSLSGLLRMLTRKINVTNKIIIAQTKKKKGIFEKGIKPANVFLRSSSLASAGRSEI